MRTHPVFVLALALAIVLVNLVVWAVPNQPVAVDAPAGGKLLSLSFAPFREGQSPLTGVLPGPDQVDEDLKLISSQVASIRVYTSQEGMEKVPAMAGKYGLTMTQGAWLSSKLLRNEQEVNAAIRLANQYPTVIKRLVVGNEVLLRGELKPAQLAGYIERVRRSVKQPVSYADVWEFWLKYPEMADSVDFITIHLLPYWEDVPTSVDGAGERLIHAYRTIAERFPGKPILIGEAGWPTAGRSRGPAVPGVVNKARFDALFNRIAADNGFDYNLIEAFDQSWKIKQEGTVGGKWGLYSSHRQPKYRVGEPVVEDTAWPVKAGLSVLLTLGGLALLLRRRTGLPRAGLGVVAFLSAGLGMAFVNAAAVALSWHSYPQDLALAVVMLGLQAVLGLAIVGEAVRLWHEPAVLHDAEAPEPAEGAALAFWGRVAMTVLTGLAVLWSLLLIFDGRYRDFPVAPYLIPALGLLALAFCRAWRRPAGCDLAAALSASHLLGAFAQRAAGAAPRMSWPAQVWSVAGTVPISTAFALLLPAGAVGTVIAEQWINREAVIWAALQLALAVPFIATVVATGRGTEPLPPSRQL